MTVRANNLFGNSSGSITAKTLFTAPADRTAILRTVTVYNSNATLARDIEVYIDDDAGTGRAVIVERQIPPLTLRRIDTWLVVEPGRRVQCIAPAGQIFLTGHGSLLDGAPQ